MNDQYQPYDQQEHASSRALIDPGTYTAHAVKHALTETKNGSSEFAIEFEIDEDGPYIGWHITKFFSFATEKLEKATFEALEACGWDRETDLNSIPELPTQVRIVVEHEEYQGKVSARVRYVNPLDWQRPTGALIEKHRMDPAKAAQVGRDLLARYRMGKGGSNAQPAASTPTRAPAATSPSPSARTGASTSVPATANRGAPARSVTRAAPPARTPAPTEQADDGIPF